ncbi:DNA repair metallo-beta-lactamase-domain-containing protein [Lactarius quietus]|nr:DNA repair metallo-beta-lactamase-domain-containing protein [Lactarius quietus]
MAPLKKPLFVPPPPATLDHFFTKPDASIINRNASSSASKRVKPSLSTSRIKHPPQQEIIILDSDDEDAPAPAVRTKRKAKNYHAPAESTSSDIEVVETDDVREPGKKAKTGFGGAMFPVQDESLHFAEFGRPKLLIPMEDETPTTTCGFENLITIDDEWGTGDDELVRTIKGEFEDVLELADDDEPSSASGDNNLDQCPFCGRGFSSLTPLDIQSHINDCCDSFSPSSGPNTSTPPRQLKCEDLTDGNAFSVLMSSRKANEAWEEAEMADDRSFRPTKANGGRRKAPFYKVMQGMPIAVDAFCYGAIPGVTSYFLTHAHSDHYTSLSSTWQAGPIYCSEGTANLIIHMLSVDPKWVHPLPMDVPTMVPESGGVAVTLIEANHCPGSALFLFEGPQTVNAGDSIYKSSHVGSTRTFRYLHCGDFRASPQHTLHPAVKGKRLDIIYLDTTYLNPRYLFPAQAQVISACAELAKRLVSGQGTTGTECDKGTVSNWLTLIPKSEAKCDVKPTNTLILVGTYSIGKERIVKAIAKALQSKIYCDRRKAAILRCQSDPELHAMLTADPFSANVHLVPLNVATSDRLKEYMARWNGHWSKAVAFRPTGWSYSPPSGTNTTTPPVATTLSKPPHREFTHAHLRPSRGSTPTAQLFGVPYSEHSSFYELTCFAMSLDWARIVATVNVESPASRAKISAWVARWEAERRRRPVGFVPPYRALEYW